MRSLLIIFLFGLSAKLMAQEKGPRLNMALSQAYQQAIISKDSSAISTIYLQGDVSKIVAGLEKNGIVHASFYGSVIRCQIPSWKLLDFAQIDGISVIEEGNKQGQLLDDSTRYYSNADSVLGGLGGLTSAYTGKGVIMGSIDTGVDYTHGDFRNPGDSLSRILRFFDFNTTPVSSYSQAQVNQNLINPTLPIDDSWHGTHVAGVAVGNGLANGTFKGMAPEAHLVVADLTPSLEFDHIIGAADSIFQFARTQNKPCVINCSIGSNYGPHDGSDSYSLALESMVKADSGRAMIIAAGNSTTFVPHLGYNLSSDTNFTYLSSTNSNPLYLQMYLPATGFNGQFRFGLDTLNTSSKYRKFTQSPFRTASQIPQLGIQDTLKHPNGTPYCIISSYASNYTNNRVLVEFLLTYLSPAGLKTPIYRMEMTGSGSFHLWAPNSSMINSVATYGKSLSDTSKYKKPDDQYSMAGYFNCAKDLISVANFNNRSAWVVCGGSGNTNLTASGVIASSSSFGPNIDGTIKPDISAAGDNTLAARSSNVPFPDSKAAVGCLHRRAGGTSNATAVITGAVCMYLQANPKAGWYTIKSDLLHSATSDSKTGVVPNSRWGYGKLNTMKFVQFGEQKSCRNIQGIGKIHAQITSNIDSICVGNSAQITASGSGSGLNYLWNNQNTTAQITTSTPGSYYAIITDSKGCRDTTSIKTIIQKPFATGKITANNNLIGALLTLTGTSIKSIQWQWGNQGNYAPINGSNGYSIIANNTGNYRALLTHNNGCVTYSDTIVIINPPTGQFQWVKSLGCNRIDEVQWVASKDNAIYVAGIFNDSIFDGESGQKATKSTITQDAFLAKLDTFGQVQWIKYLQGIYAENFTALHILPNGNVLAAASFKASARYNQTTWSNIRINQDCILLEIDPNQGNVLWQQILPGNNNRRITSITSDSLGNFYLGGWFTGDMNWPLHSFSSVGGTDLFIAKFDTSKTPNWVIHEGGVSEDILTQMEYSNGKIIGVGYLCANRYNGAFGLGSSGIYDGMYFQIDANTGGTIWAKKIGGTGSEYIRSLTTNHNGKVWICGTHDGDLRFNKSILPKAQGEDFFLAEINSNNGQIVWCKKSSGSGNEQLNAIGYENNTIWAGGYLGNSLQWDAFQYSGNTSQNWLAAQFDTAGSILWMKTSTSTGANRVNHSCYNQGKWIQGGSCLAVTGFGSYSTTYHGQTDGAVTLLKIGQNNVQTQLLENTSSSLNTLSNEPLNQSENEIVFLGKQPIRVQEMETGEYWMQHGNNWIGNSQHSCLLHIQFNDGSSQLNWFQRDENSSVKNKNSIVFNGNKLSVPEPLDWTIWRMDGGLVFHQKNSSEINLSEYLANGVYIVRVSSKDAPPVYQKIIWNP